MNATTEFDAGPVPEFIVLPDVSWELYQQILDVLGEYHLRHTYDEGSLEMRRVLGGVSWEDYLRLMEVLGDYKLRHTYDEGTLEMMSPGKDHEWIAELIARMIGSAALLLDIPMHSVGSTSLRTIDARYGGLPPDKAFYFAHESLVRSKRTYDPATDPPPDLVVEIDITHSAVPRLPAFARIGVPEVWRLQEGGAAFYELAGDGTYHSVDRSIALPFLTPGDVARFVARRSEIGENALVREFARWAETAPRGPAPS